MEKKAALDIKPITQLSAFISNESERKGWTEEKYKRKNNDKEKNNHYDWSRRKLDFEVTKNGKIKELGSNPVSLYERLKIRLGELGFTLYKSNSPNVPRICANIVVSGNSEQLRKLAFGQQKVDYSDEGMGKNGDVKRVCLESKNLQLMYITLRAVNSVKRMLCVVMFILTRQLHTYI